MSEVSYVVYREILVAATIESAGGGSPEIVPQEGNPHRVDFRFAKTPEFGRVSTGLATGTIKPTAEAVERSRQQLKVRAILAKESVVSR